MKEKVRDVGFMKKIMETKRLYLRELAAEDKRELTKLLSDPEAMRYYPEPFDEETVAGNVGMRRYKVFERDAMELVAQVIYNDR